MEQLRLITVVGLKGSGKTTVVEALVAEMRARGHEVGTVKAMRHHPVPLGAEGTDTRRHAAAGASVVVALCSDGTARFQKGAPPASLDEVLRLFPGSIRILVSEGAIDQTAPQSVVLCLKDPSELQQTLERRGIPESSVAAISGRVASARGAVLLPGIPSFDVTDPAQRKALADHVLGKIVQPYQGTG